MVTEKTVVGAITKSGASRFNATYPLSTRKVQFIGARVGFISWMSDHSIKDRAILAEWNRTREFTTLQGENTYPKLENGVETYIPLARVSSETYNNDSTFVTMSVLLSKDLLGMSDVDTFHEIGYFCQVCMNNPLPWGQTLAYTKEDVVNFSGDYRRGDIVTFNSSYWVCLDPHKSEAGNEPRLPGSEITVFFTWSATDPRFVDSSPPLGTIVKHGSEPLPGNLTGATRHVFYELIAYPEFNPRDRDTVNPANILDWVNLDPTTIEAEITRVKYDNRIWIATRSWEEHADWPWHAVPSAEGSLWRIQTPKFMVWENWEPGESPDVWRKIDLEKVYWEVMDYPRDSTTTPPRWVPVPGAEGDPWLMYYVAKYVYPICLESGSTTRYAFGIQLHSAEELEAIYIPQEDTAAIPEFQLHYLQTMNAALRSIRDVWRENQVLRVSSGSWYPNVYYSKNDVVVYGDKIWRSLKDGNAQTSWNPLSSTQRLWLEVTTDVITLRDNWSQYTSYLLFDVVVHNGKLWINNTGGTVGVDKEPGNETASVKRWAELT